MTNIVKFPRTKRTGPEPAKPPPRQVGKPVSDPRWLKGLWVTTVLVWPFLKWIVVLDCVWQLMRTMYYWDTPGEFAGMKFLLHFAVLVALTYFVSCYKPKGL